MLEILNEIIGATPRGRLDLETIRSHVKPQLIEAWEDRLEKPSIYGIEITGSEIHVNKSLCFECGDRHEAEKFLLYLLALSSESARIDKIKIPSTNDATSSETESCSSSNNDTTNKGTPYYQGGWRKNH